MFKKLCLSLLALIAMSGASRAQEIDVDKYNLSVRVDFAASQLDVQAQLALSNPSDSPKPKIFLRLMKTARLNHVTVDGTEQDVKTSEDLRFPGLMMIEVTPSQSLEPGAKVTVGVNYSLPAPESSPLLSVYPGEVLALPQGVWFPAPSSDFAIYGSNTAPFSMSVTAASAPSGFSVAAPGTPRTDGHGFIFDQTLNSLPFLVGGAFDAPAESEHGGVKIRVYVQPGLSAAGSQAGAGEDAPGPAAQHSSPAQSSRITDEVGRIVDFLSRTLGPPPQGASFNVVSSARAGNTSVPGGLILNETIFRQDALDATTTEVLADAVSRIWIDGRVRIRGQDSRAADADKPAQRARSAGLLSESLPRYLAALYLGNRYGAGAEQEVFARMRANYAPVGQAHRDSPISVQTLLLGTYSDATLAKGPLVLRLFSHVLGPERVIAAVKQLTGKPATAIVTATDFKDALGKDKAVDKLFDAWVDNVFEPDLIIGIPVPSGKPNVQRVALRNLITDDTQNRLGNRFECSVNVAAITGSGQRLVVPAVIPSQDVVSVEIPTSDKIASVELDPEKYIIQTNYDNDARPPVESPPTLLNEGIVAFNKGDFTLSENKLRKGVGEDGENSLLHAWLSRALAAQGKADEAAAQALAATRIQPPLSPALAWAHMTMAQQALARGQDKAAIPYLKLVLVESEETPAQIAARTALAKAEKAAGGPQVEDSVRAFITHLDQLLKQPSSDTLFQVVIKNNLKRFVQGLTVSPPESWSTEILRAERVDANRVEVDVGLKVRASGRDQAGSAVYTLYHAPGGWMLENITLFEVK